MNKEQRIIGLVALLASCIVFAYVYYRIIQPQWIQGYVEGEFTYMASPQGGRLEKLLVQRGDPVNSQQLLFVLESEPEYSEYLTARHAADEANAKLVDLQKGQRPTQLDAIKAQIKQAEAQFSLADIRLKRAKKMYAIRAISADAVDEAQTVYKAASDQLKQVRANLAEAELGGRVDAIKAAESEMAAAKTKLDEATWVLQQKSIKAPGNGFVYDTFYRQGEYVAATKPVVSLLLPENIYVIFYVSTSQLGQLTIDQSILVHCDGCDKTHVAKINYISPQAEYTPPLVYSRDNNDKLIFRVQARFAEKVSLHPGQPVYVSFPANLKKE